MRTEKKDGLETLVHAVMFMYKGAKHGLVLEIDTRKNLCWCRCPLKVGFITIFVCISTECTIGKR